MFLGHYGVALGAKRAAPRVRLGVLILAAQWADLLWPVLLLAGVERVSYARATAPRDCVGNLALWALVLFLLIVHVASVVGPPPPNTASLATAGLAGWLFVPWGCWIDRHRRPA